MIVNVDIPNGYTKVVSNPLDVEIATRLGWRLVAITEATFTVPGPQSTNYINGNPVTSYGPSTEHATISYVLHLDEESSLALAGREREEAVAKTGVAQKALADAEKVAKEAVAVAENTRALYERKVAACDLLDERLREERGARQRLETDLGKIRTAIGDVRFKELIMPTRTELLAEIASRSTEPKKVF
jgi:hypothetical protein